MTCIVGIVEDERVWIGGDSAGTDGWLDRTIRADQKVFKKDGFVMGFCGSFRMGQLLRYRLHVPKPRANETVDEYMCTTFIDEVRSCLKNGGFAQVKDGVDRAGHSQFLVGFKSRLFCVQEDFQVSETVRDFTAIGSGESFAIGALYALDKAKPNLGPRDRIRRALEIAELCNAGVAGPFKIEAL